MTIGSAVRPRSARIKGVLVPLPAPGAPPSHMISLGNTRFSRPCLDSSLAPDLVEDQLGVFDLQILLVWHRIFGVGGVGLVTHNLDSNSSKGRKKALRVPEGFVAEREGFEPPEACTSMVFKTTAFNRSAIAPCAVAYQRRSGSYQT